MQAYNDFMKKSLPSSTLYLLSISAGLIVANLYYNQPLLQQMSEMLQVTEAQISHVALSTQIGYALGLLLIIPLGDKISNLKIVRWDFLVLIASLIGAAAAPNLEVLVFCSFVIGFSSTLPQLFVPMVAHLSTIEARGKSIGIVMSGLLIGILGSRVLSGITGEYFGWRSVFYGAAVLMVLLFILLNKALPVIKPVFTESYGKLMRSLAFYLRSEKSLQMATLRGALAFGSLSILSLCSKILSGMGVQLPADSDFLELPVRWAQPISGKLNSRVPKRKLLLVGAGLITASWILFFFSTYSLIGLIIGIIVIDLGVQAVHITNQNIVFSRNSEARNRVNTIYMVGFFIGGAAGTSLGAIAWHLGGWAGVSLLGLAFAVAMLLLIIFGKKSIY